MILHPSRAIDHGIDQHGDCLRTEFRAGEVRP